ncbi:preprotein translocase subunit SecA [Buchananella felis]|uniref:preprotein translocase subunit SecA n=1 Tax=Buchananella felis TaxID=3231492 RepID=UPI003528519A
MGLFERILRIGEGRTLKRLERIADDVEALADAYRELTDEELRGLTEEFRQRLADGASYDDILPEAFAAVREAADRTLGMRHFRVQIMGGAALHLGNIAEMKTGEGKTLVATLPSYLRALDGKGVHVVTVNDYLASYQSDLMGRVYRFLGLSTGCILAGQTPAERREQYACDITYGTNNEFGFDYLRDNMAQRTEDLVQRGHNFVIVDEVDSILIDEARTPLIISGPATGGVNEWYAEFAKLVQLLEREVDYEVDEKKRTVGVLEAGIEKVEDLLGVENLYEAAHTPLIGFLNNAVKAKELFKRDRDYIVHNGEVMIVDEHTGRVLPGRRYNEGMHQAIEAKEGVEIKAENQTFATITLQNYFRLYPEGSRSGMTGTAETEAAEFVGTYKIGVVPIPTNKPMIRKDQQDLVYRSVAGKLKAVVEDIVERHKVGQPVLVGTTSVEKSEELSALLKKAGVPHEVLNAKHHEREAAVVAMAGRKGAVTVATNMAGRGTDIMLGGNAEHIARANLESRGINAHDDSDEFDKAWPTALAEAREAVAAEHDEVAELGGLYVLGTERHESRRIDNQLRGRAGRQGDPGESRFYLSMEDDLMRLFNSGLAKRIMEASNFPEDVPLEFSAVTKGIASAQNQVEARNFDIRKNVLKYDDVMTEQREKVYEQRRQVLNGEDMENQVLSFIDLVIPAAVAITTADPDPKEWDLESLWSSLRSVYPVQVGLDEFIEEAGGRQGVTREAITEELLEDIRFAYQQVEEGIEANPIAKAQLGEDPMRELERRVLLSVVDERWRSHLYEMDYLKEGIGLRAMAQRDPLVEYANEGSQMFKAMMDAIREETIQGVFAYAKRFESALEQFKEQAAAQEAQAAAAAQAESVMGETGKKAVETNVTLSGPDPDDDSTAVTEADAEPLDATGTQPLNREQKRRQARAAKRKR